MCNKHFTKDDLRRMKEKLDNMAVPVQDRKIDLSYLPKKYLVQLHHYFKNKFMVQRLRKASPIPPIELLCPQEELSDEDYEFQRCSDCDGHDACEDYGCAIAADLDHLMNPDVLPY